jgi:hypothetical protein
MGHAWVLGSVLLKTKLPLAPAAGRGTGEANVLPEDAFAKNKYDALAERVYKIIAVKIITILFLLIAT